MADLDLQQLLGNSGLHYNPDAPASYQDPMPQSSAPPLAAQLAQAGIRGVPLGSQVGMTARPANPATGGGEDLSGMAPMTDAQARAAGYHPESAPSNVAPQAPAYVPPSLDQIATERAAAEKAKTAEQAKARAVPGAGTGGTSNPMQAYWKAQQAETTALSAEQAADQGANAQLVAAARQKTDFLNTQSNDIISKAREHDENIGSQMDKLDSLSRDAASKKIDPDRWYKNQSTGQRILWILAAGASGFAAGWNKTGGNMALDAMRAHMNDDLEAQKQEIESAKGRIEDQKGILGETYKRFGNMDQAMSAARIVGLQKLDSDAAANAAVAQSPVVASRYDMLRAQLGTSIAKEKAEFAQKAAASAAGQMPSAKEIGEKALEIQEKAANNGTNMTPEQAREIALRSFGKGTGADIGGGFPKAPRPAPTPGQAQINNQVNATREALEHLHKIQGMLEEGGKISPTRTAQGESERSQAINAMSRAETGGNRAPSENERALLEQQLPKDPNSFQWTGADKARVKSAIDSLEQKLRDLGGAPPEEEKKGPPPSSASLGITPAK